MLCLGADIWLSRRQCVPITIDPHIAAAVDDEPVPGGQFLYILEQGLRCGRCHERQVIGKGSLVNITLDIWVLEYRLDLGPKQKPAVFAVVIKRLDAHPIAV